SALARAGAEPAVSAGVAEIAGAPLVVIAGVGHTGAASRELEARGLAEPLRERVAAGRPLLGICVGMQLLFGESEEGGCGLGLLAGVQFHPERSAAAGARLLENVLAWSRNA